MKLIIIAVLLFSSLLINSCKKDNPVIPPVEPPPIIKDTITISLKQVTHTSTVINIKTTSHNINSKIEFYRQFNNSDTLVTEYPLTIEDTTITDDNNGEDLQLNTEYKYFAIRIDSTGENKDTSNIITAKTLAATSLNYSWQEFSIGEPGSVLYDVWGSDENNIYACGIITISDTIYGVLHCNGNNWSPVKRNGGVYSMFGFSPNDIWVVGGSIFHFEGQLWNEILFDDQILVDNIPYYSVWGTSSSNLYFGSGRRKIIHWDGSGAEIVYSNPENVYVNDLDGYSSDYIIGVGTGMVPPLLAVYYNGSNWNSLPISNNQYINAVSIVTRKHIYFSGGGIFEMKGNNISRIFNSGYYIWDIEYDKQTGITVAVGAYDGVYINNGEEWRDFTGTISNDETTYNGIYLINNKIICVGRNATQAKIIIGRN